MCHARTKHTICAAPKATRDRRDLRAVGETRMDVWGLLIEAEPGMRGLSVESPVWVGRRLAERAPRTESQGNGIGGEKLRGEWGSGDVVV